MLTKVSFLFQTSSAEASPIVTPSSTPGAGTQAPKYGTLVPNRVFVGGIAANTTEQELKQFFTGYGAVKDTKIIVDRAGVSKGYGFVTFESQEDADKIIKNEADNLVFKDRKLNIGPAIRKQQQQMMNRSFGVESLSPELLGPIQKETNLGPGVFYSNGVPYTYQNGMAIFHAPDTGYPIAQPQTPTYQVVPQTPTVYVTPQSYSAYQPATPQWAPATAAAATQWRWTQQSPQQAVTASPGYYYAAVHTSPELMYAQAPPQIYQPGEVPDATVMDNQAMEGSLFHKPVEQPLLSTPVSTESNTTSNTTIQQPCSAVTSVPETSTLKLVSGTPNITTPVAMAMPLPQPVVPTGNTVSLTKPTYSSSTAPYPKKSVTAIPRRPFSSPTLLVKHGHKVQRVMMPAKAVTPNGHMTYLRDDGIPGYSLIAPASSETL
ncbi:hypothetical protein FSP39_018516 [Pinctada imbricata]|uniref:RRM domain-containing protein n=1 Tax=Pinctada imbricata TaxID=66713 RepID=A0AA89CC03_PINIB|nr:hypothetical protein FSP39_018516 [Pinctada imbricata]